MRALKSLLLCASIAVTMISTVGAVPTEPWVMPEEHRWFNYEPPAPAMMWPEPTTQEPKWVEVDPEPRPSLASSTVWDALAQCESGGNWSEGDGGMGPYRGGLQWLGSSWDAWRPAGTPSDAAEATREQEIAAAEAYRAWEQSQGRGGYGPWPACARKLSLPR